MKTWIFVISIALAGIVVLVLSEHSKQRRQHARTSAAIEAVSRDLNEVAQQATRTRLQMLVPRPPDRGSPQVDPAPTTSNTDIEAQPGDEQEAPPALEVEEVRDRLDVFFREERTDASWGHQARQRIQQRIDTVLPENSFLLEVDCHSSMCRIETMHASLDDYQQFVRASFMSPETKLWNGGFFASIKGEPENGEVITVAYLARDGQDLPALDVAGAE